MQNSNEKWKPVVGYEGSCEVSSLGNVRSIDRHVIDPTNFGRRFLKGKMMKLGRNPRSAKARIHVRLCRYGVHKTLDVHRESKVENKT